MGGPCCPMEEGYPHCPAKNLYCQIRGPSAASINDTRCLEIGGCGHEGQPICEHSYATAQRKTVVHYRRLCRHSSCLVAIVKTALSQIRQLMRGSQLGPPYRRERRHPAGLDAFRQSSFWPAG